MRRLALGIVVSALAASSPASADPAPIGAHLACFHGHDKQPIQKRRALTKDVSCKIVVDQGEPPPSASATVSIHQHDPPAAGGGDRTADRFVPQDDGDGIEYVFDPFKLGADFKACKDFVVAGTVTDGGKTLWQGEATIQTQCKAARKLPLQLGCHWDGDLVCVLQTKDLKHKVPPGVVGIVALGADKVHTDTFADYPDDTYAVEARFAKGDVACTGASIRGLAENEQGQALFDQTITAPACP
jgi:hypothetical protein